MRRYLQAAIQVELVISEPAKEAVLLSTDCWLAFLGWCSHKLKSQR